MKGAPPPARAWQRPWVITLGLVMLVMGTVVVTLWIARTWLHPQPFEPVVLDAAEHVALNAKLARLAPAERSPAPEPQPATPERYAETAAARVLHFNQRELNALIARNPDLAGRMALHLARDFLSATLLITLPPDLPVLAGRTVRVHAGATLKYEHNRPVIALEGVSLMGVPLPSAWLGGLKGRDLMREFDTPGGFWHTVGEGIKDLRVEDGLLRIELAE